MTQEMTKPISIEAQAMELLKELGGDKDKMEKLRQYMIRLRSMQDKNEEYLQWFRDNMDILNQNPPPDFFPPDLLRETATLFTQTHDKINKEIAEALIHHERCYKRSKREASARSDDGAPCDCQAGSR